jgi:hypothetical protein
MHCIANIGRIHGIAYGSVFGRVGFKSGDMVNVQSRQMHHENPRMIKLSLNVRQSDVSSSGVVKGIAISIARDVFLVDESSSCLEQREDSEIVWGTGASLKKLL